MRFNTDEAEETTKFTEGKRYNLVIADAEEGTAKTTGTPFLKLSLKTEAGDNAYDHKLYNTPKAMYRAVEWFKAMGFDTSKPLEIDPASLRGIKLSALCTVEKYNTEEPDGEGGTKVKEHAITKWDKPERVSIASTPAPARKAAAPAPKPEPVDESVPF